MKKKNSDVPKTYQLIKNVQLEWEYHWCHRLMYIQVTIEFVHRNLYDSTDNDGDCKGLIFTVES